MAILILGPFPGTSLRQAKQSSDNPQTHSYTFCISIRVCDPKHFFLNLSVTTRSG